MLHTTHLISAVDSHTGGEPTRVITAGLPLLVGATMADKRAYLRDTLDPLRTALAREPRGHEAMVLAYLTPPVTPGASMGVIFANGVGYLGMCGHGSIGVATVLVSLGMVPVEEPVTTVVLDTPAGVVACRVRVEKGRARSVRLRNVPSFLAERDVQVDVPGLGPLAVDVAYGGNWFAIVPEDRVGVAIDASRLPALVDVAVAIRGALAAQGVVGKDPRSGEAGEIDHVEIYAHREARGGRGVRTFTLCPGRAYDRSPCGTGTSAKLATLFARGELGVGEVFSNQSVLGTEFVGQVVEEVRVGDKVGVVPEIEGSAYITGVTQFVLPEDPLVHGAA